MEFISDFDETSFHEVMLGKEARLEGVCMGSSEGWKTALLVEWLCGPAAAAAGSRLAVQNVGLHPRPTESEYAF